MCELVLTPRQERTLDRVIERALSEGAPVRSGERDEDADAAVLRAARATFGSEEG